jgi:hypothetical protein
MRSPFLIRKDVPAPMFDDLGSDAPPPPEEPVRVKRTYRKRADPPMPTAAPSPSPVTPSAPSAPATPSEPVEPPPTQRETDSRVTKFIQQMGNKPIKTISFEPKQAPAPATFFGGGGGGGTRADDKPTPIKGMTKLQLERQIVQMRELFPLELANFKMKKGEDLSEDYLKKCVEEMDAIVSCSSADNFLLDSVVSCIRGVEAASSFTSFDITGLADMLKENKQFEKLSKQLFVRYNVFGTVSPEYQMIILVSTSAWVCRTRNQSKRKVAEMIEAPASATAAEKAQEILKRRRTGGAEPAAPAVGVPNVLEGCN